MKNETKQDVPMAPTVAGIEVATMPPEAKTPAGILVVKLQDLGDLSHEIAKHARKLSKKEKADIDALEAEMNERVQTCLIEGRIKEADIKLEIMGKIVTIVKSK